MWTCTCTCACTCRYFRGKDIVVTAVRPLAAGDVVAENYGPIFTKRSLQQRQRTLNSRYWFRCCCAACAEDWPLMEHLHEDDVKLRCVAYCGAKQVRSRCEGYACE